jgi:hypothetical protein
VSYKKGKQNLKRKEWAVSKYDTPSGIMMYDEKTADSLRERIFGAGYKGDKSFMITKVNEKKIVGYAANK